MGHASVGILAWFLLGAAYEAPIGPYPLVHDSFKLAVHCGFESFKCIVTTQVGAALHPSGELYEVEVRHLNGDANLSP